MLVRSSSSLRNRPFFFWFQPLQDWDVRHYLDLGPSEA